MSLPTPEDDRYAQAWSTMHERAIDILRTGAMEHGLPPVNLDSEEGELLTSGIAIGIAAAAQHYKDNPHDIPRP